jgi:hypothetical protein
MMRSSEAQRLGVAPKVVIVGHATHADKPSLFAMAPIGGMRTLAEKTGWNLCDVDLFEINEAFAVVAMTAIHDLDLPQDKVNVHGGACALGHAHNHNGSHIELERPVASLRARRPCRIYGQHLMPRITVATPFCGKASPAGLGEPKHKLRRQSH